MQPQKLKEYHEVLQPFKVNQLTLQWKKPDRIGQKTLAPAFVPKVANKSPWIS
jgi:hypothetical protein